MELIKPTQNIYLSLREGAKVKDLDRSEILKKLIELIGRAHFETGQINSFDKDRAHSEAIILCDDIKNDYSSITLDELGEAFKRGVRKTYGDYFGLSVVTYLGWIKSFITDVARTEAIIKSNHKVIEKAHTPEEIRAIEDQTLTDILIEYKKHGKVYNFGNARYNLLVKRGLIQELAYIDFMEVAERIVYSELNIELENAKSSGNRLQWRNISADLDKIVEGESDAVKKKACDMVVNEYARFNSV